MIHTVQITHRMSQDWLNFVATNVFDRGEIDSLIHDHVTYLEAEPYQFTGINEIKVYKANEFYIISLVVNLQSLTTQENTISLFDCSPESIQLLNRQFSDTLSDIGLRGFSPITEWWAKRVDFAIDVTTHNVDRYVALAKMENRPAWFIDRVDEEGSAYPESKYCTLNFYDKLDQVRKKLTNVPDFNRLEAEAENIFRLEVQCESNKLKDLRRRKFNLPNIRLGGFLNPDISINVVAGYYYKVLGYQDFHSMAQSERIVAAYPHCGSARKRNFINWLRYIADYDTLPDAKFAFNRSPGTWYNYMRLSREIGINPITIPADMGFDNLPNPLPEQYRIAARDL